MSQSLHQTLSKVHNIALGEGYLDASYKIPNGELLTKAVREFLEFYIIGIDADTINSGMILKKFQDLTYSYLTGEPLDEFIKMFFTGKMFAMMGIIEPTYTRGALTHEILLSVACIALFASDELKNVSVDNDMHMRADIMTYRIRKRLNILVENEAGYLGNYGYVDMSKNLHWILEELK